MNKQWSRVDSFPLKPKKNEERIEIINNLDVEFWNARLLLEHAVMFHIPGNEYIIYELCESDIVLGLYRTLLPSNDGSIGLFP